VDTSASEYIRFGMDIMLHVLKDHPNSKIEWRIDDPEYLEYQANRVAFVTPHLHVRDAKIVSLLDAMIMRIQNKWFNLSKQRGDFNDWKGMACRKMVLMFDSSGKVVQGIFNAPGRQHDSDIVLYGGLYHHIWDNLPDPYHVASDTGFIGGMNIQQDKILHVLKTNQYYPANMTVRVAKGLEKELTKVRQSVEHGNNGMKQVARRFDEKLRIDDDWNLRVQTLIAYVYNWRVATCTRNQIQAYFRFLEEDNGLSDEDEDDELGDDEDA
jgi:hypothetical protein